jgi:hypothetical protein
MPNEMTLREESARAQSIGVSLETYRRMSPAERSRRASLTGSARTQRGLATTDETTPPPPPLGDGGGYTLTFAQTEAGQRLAAALALDTERIAGKERLKLEDTLHSLAMDLLPPKDVETAMRQVRRGELVKSKLAFQAVLQNLADEAEHAERRKDLRLQEENERRTLRNARARITVDMVGRDLGRAILFALGGSSAND